MLFYFVMFRRKNAFGLLVAFCRCSKANGSIYWDDGESLGIIEDFPLLFLLHMFYVRDCPQDIVAISKLFFGDEI